MIFVFFGVFLGDCCCVFGVFLVVFKTKHLSLSVFFFSGLLQDSEGCLGLYIFLKGFPPKHSKVVHLEQGT